MVIKKQWYEIVATKLFDEKMIGETLSADPKRLIGRTVSVSLADLTGDYSKFYIKLLFQIEKIDDKARAKFIGHECMHERVYRMVHRYMRRVDCVHDIVTMDKKKVRIKIVFILLKRVNTSIKDSARNATKKILEKIAKEKTFEEFVKMIITEELQNTIKKEISKIYPVGNLEIRKSELLEEKKELIPEAKAEKKAESKRIRAEKKVEAEKVKARQEKEPETRKGPRTESKEDVKREKAKEVEKPKAEKEKDVDLAEKKE